MNSRLIEEKVREIAKAHSQIIEDECRKACEKFNVTGDQLIIQYSSDAKIKITVIASDFQITNNFTYNNGKINE